MLALNVCAASGPALAAEKYTLYDNFQATDIDPARWQDAERVRSVTGDKLRLMQRYWGATDTDTVDPVSPHADTATGARVPVVPPRPVPDAFGHRLSLLT